MGIRSAVARQLHARGVYRIGANPFGAIDKTLLFERFSIDFVFDVGANDGSYGKHLRDLGYSGRIISVEPGSEAFGRLATAARDDGLWEAHQLAAGADAEARTFNIATNLVSSSLLPLADAFASADASITVAAEETVQVVRLDTFADQVPAGARLWVKLDIEGHELPAISGAPELLQKTQCVEIELATRRLYDDEPLFYEVAPTLYEHGFELTAVASAYATPAGQTVRFDALFARL